MLKLVLIVEIIFLLGNAAIISRDYQDSWTLEGLEIPFMVFMITYTISFIFEKKITWMVILAVICRSTILLIPNLKYVWFQGRSIDQQVHYNLARYIHDEGHLATQAVFSGSISHQFYTNTPLMHLSFAIFSIITNIPVLNSYKYLPVLWSPMYPLITYTMIKKLKLTKKPTLLKYALFFSSVPISPALSYIVTGSMFGVLLSFLILSQIVILLQKNDRRHLVLLFFFSSALIMAHSFSSVQLIILISIVIFLLRLFSTKIKSYREILMAIALLTIAWLMFEATKPLESMVDTIVSSARGILPTTGFIPFRFFELAHTNIFESLRITLIFYGAEIFMAFLTLLSIPLVLKIQRQSNALRFLFLFIASIWGFLMIGTILRVGAFFYVRIMRWPLILYPIFASIFLLQINKRKGVAIIFSLVMVLATIQLYGCQPIVPPANVLLKDLPPDEPLVYIVQVNSIYQRQMIEYAEKYVRGRIACDGVTTNQINGLTRHNFSQTYVIWYYPFSRLLDESIPEKEYDYFLIHLPGKSGAFKEQAEIRTRSLILGALNNLTYSIVYSNGESYILAKS